MQIPNNPIHTSLDHLTEPQIREAIIATRSCLSAIDRTLSPHCGDIPQPSEFLIRSENELSKMSEPDLLQEIANVSSFLSLNGDISEIQNSHHLLLAETSLKALEALHDMQVSMDHHKFCVCQRFHHPDRSMVQCDVCQDWFHLTCVNLGAEELASLTHYVCPSCNGQTSVFEAVRKIALKIDFNYNTKTPKSHWDPPAISEMSEGQLMGAICASRIELEKTEREVRKRLCEIAEDDSFVVDMNSTGAELGVRTVVFEGKKTVVKIPRVFIGGGYSNGKRVNSEEEFALQNRSP